VQLNKTTVAIGLIGIACLAGGALWISSRQEAATTAQPPAISVQVLPLGAKDLPTEGRLGLANSPSRFAQFRVGNKNVKAMFVDGPITWIGTSGGVIRYDTNSDAYRVYDNQNGLLSNGIFSIGRIKGKLTVGTYG